MNEASVTREHIKWTFIIIIYSSSLYLYGFRAALFFLLFIGISAEAYTRDKERETEGTDHFRGGWLFYRYGEELEDLFLNIPIKSGWDAEKTTQFAKDLQARLAQIIQSRLPSDLVHLKDDIQITDLGTGEKKSFVRIVAQSKHGSMLTHFIHYAPFGQTLTAHYFTYLRGVHSEWDVVKFAIASPFTIWSWGIPWLLNQHSIITEISHFRPSSFDAIDIKTLYSMSKSVIIDATEQILQEAGLLTEDLRQVINYHKHNHVNKLSISNSSNVNIGNLSQSTSFQPMQRAS